MTASGSRKKGDASARLAAAIAAGKLAGRASRVLRRGGGTALPGLVAERLDPRLVARLAPRLGQGSLVVTGTNGKTTTAHMLSSVATAAGYLPLHNRSGSNLMRGVATALIDDAGLLGGLSHADRRLGVFEVDEAILPEAVRALAPRVLIFTNLFRDQLDRCRRPERRRPRPRPLLRRRRAVRRRFPLRARRRLALVRRLRQRVPL
ncbi:MAG: Mur ligase family protein [Dehalococcoidia bacterium]